MIFECDEHWKDEGTLRIAEFFLPHSYNAEECPAWVYLLTAASIVVYINLDCMDGKQARRTKSSSPLVRTAVQGTCLCAERVLDWCISVQREKKLALLVLRHALTLLPPWTVLFWCRIDRVCLGCSTNNVRRSLAENHAYFDLLTSHRASCLTMALMHSYCEYVAYVNCTTGQGTRLRETLCPLVRCFVACARRGLISWLGSYVKSPRHTTAVADQNLMCSRGCNSTLNLNPFPCYPQAHDAGKYCC